MSKTGIIKVLAVVIIGLIGSYIGYRISYKPKRLKIYNPTDVNPNLVSHKMKKVYKDHKIRDFKLVDQLGDTVTQTNFKGKIYVADFFFTTCKSICPKMGTQLQRVQEAYKNDTNLMILSHTVYPEEDSVPVLAAYADLYDVNPKKWMLVTGSKKEIYDLARNYYFAVNTKGDGGKDDFIHTENFMLIDPNKRIRGYYDGTSPADVDRLIKEIKILEAEFYQ